MNKKLKIIFSIYLIVAFAVGLVVISNFSETEDKSEIADATLLSNSKIPGTVFKTRGSLIRIIMLK
ncbi:MAG TPA: hypothetical protein PK655_03580 [archaeon]|nr:hypothetical protein [archaeon]HPV66501.1 hypothetical protein [archaeon]